MAQRRRDRLQALPRHAERNRRALERAPQGPVDEADGTCHVVVAEDDAEMRRLLGERLREEGYDVTEIGDGGELSRFLEAAWRDPRPPAPDLLISDVRMPGQTGLGVLRDIRQSDWSFPVILITAFGDDEAHGEASRLGAKRVFDKPFDLEDLVSEVRTLLPEVG